MTTESTLPSQVADLPHGDLRAEMGIKKQLPARRVIFVESSKYLSATTLLWFMAALYGFPVLWFVLSSFKPSGDLFSYPVSFLPQHFTVHGYIEAWHSFNVGLYLENTLIVASCATLMTLAASACTGYALAKYDNWWVKGFFICILASTMLSTQTILLPTFLVIRDVHLYNNLLGIIIPNVMSATGCFLFRQFFKNVPDDLIEAARMDGANELRIFLRVMAPLARPAFVTLAIFSFVWRWNDFIWPLLVLSNPRWFTLQIGIENLVNTTAEGAGINWSVLLGASIIEIIPLVLIYLAFQRYVMSTDVMAGIKF